MLCIGPLRGSLHLQPSLPDRQKPSCFSQLYVIWVPFGLWCYRLGSPAWGLDPAFLRGNPPAAAISQQKFSCCMREHGHPSRTSSALPISLVMVKWFLLSVLGFRASLQLVFSWLFRMISLQFSCNSRLVLGGS